MLIYLHTNFEVDVLTQMKITDTIYVSIASDNKNKIHEKKLYTPLN